jgi:hypothetical protein
MTNQHPTTPPPELVQQWVDTYFGGKISQSNFHLDLARQAAQWGADRELLACGNYLKQCAAWEEEDVTEFYNYRRPKPPSLKEQALEALDRMDQLPTFQDMHIIREALEQLDD